MISKTFKYTDFNGDVQEDTFYFHLSKADIVELELSEGENGLAATLEKIVEERDAKRILEYFKEIIGKSVGERSEDGKRFIKNDDIRDAFMQSPAYDELILEIMVSDNASDNAAKFIQGIVPAGIDLNKTAAKKAPTDRKTKATKTKSIDA